MVELYPYQREGVAFLASRKTALLADDPGLGKSLQAIRACDEVMALFVLVICPASVVETWKREIAKYRQGTGPLLSRAMNGRSGGTSRGSSRENGVS